MEGGDGIICQSYPADGLQSPNADVGSSLPRRVEEEDREEADQGSNNHSEELVAGGG